MSPGKNRIEAQNATRIRAYRPRLEQAAHSHNHPHLSMVLGGSLIERSAEEESAVAPGMFAVRAGDFSHQVRFGCQGALIISLAISKREFEGLDRADVGRWVRASDPLVRSLMARALGEGPGQFLEDAIWDVIAGDPSTAHRPPAKWLLDARDRMIEEDASISALAADAGFHRVHFSRAFGRAFGVPPSLYRRRARALRAVAAAIDGRRAVTSAYDCGFSDQSHMSRVIRSITGTSYKRLQRLRSEVTSVQD